METQQNKALEKVQDSMDVSTVIDNASELLASFSQADQSMLQKLTSEYLTLYPGTTYNLIFKNITKFKGEGGREVDACVLIDETGKEFINGSAVLVNTLKQVTQIPCFVKIITKKEEKAKTGVGKYLDMDIFTLPISVKK